LPLNTGSRISNLFRGGVVILLPHKEREAIRNASSFWVTLEKNNFWECWRYSQGFGLANSFRA